MARHPGKMVLTQQQCRDLEPLLGPTLPGFVVDFDGYDQIQAGIGDRVYAMVQLELAHAKKMREQRVLSDFDRGHRVGLVGGAFIGFAAGVFLVFVVLAHVWGESVYPLCRRLADLEPGLTPEVRVMMRESYDVCDRIRRSRVAKP